MTKFSVPTRLLTSTAVAVVGLLIASLSVTSANAETKLRRTSAAPVGGPNASYQQGPRTRIYISRRSWLDGGTEVLPGDRKFSDYAYPPEVGYPTFARENNNRPIDRQPLSPPSDLGGYPTRIPLPY